MKIHKIHVQNFKPVSDKEINLNGCSAIITAGNDKGKSSILSGLIDRLQSEKPDKIVKEGQDKGFHKMELTDGSLIEWSFTNKSERLNYTSPEGIKMSSGVISAISEKYFGKRFDIDKFLNKGPKAQQRKLQEIIGVNLEEVEKEYKEAYEERRIKNKELKRIRSKELKKPEKVTKPDIKGIKSKIEDARQQNQKANEASMKIEALGKIKDRVQNEIEGTEFEGLFDEEQAQDIIESIDIPKPINIDELEEELDEKQEQLRKYDAYERDLKEYNEWVKEGKEAKKKAEKADKEVKLIEEKKREIIESADIPEGFGFSENGLTYNGFLLDENQISTSDKYVAALKLATQAVGKVRALHFDASTLDNNKLGKVKEWADENDLQLLIERPDMDGGEIKYELIEE